MPSETPNFILRGARFATITSELAHQIFRLVHAGNAAEYMAMAAFAHVKRQAQQLGAAFHWLAVDDEGDAQIDLGEVVDGDGVGDGFAAGRRSIGVRSRFSGGKLGL
jgi:hypothetical protein